MSLHYKSINDIRYEDVEAFCAQKFSEGIRLEYKGEIPNHFGRVVAAFANTFGGLILLGVEADQAKNEPIWPPVGCDQRGLSDRIIAICQDNPYPPITPEIKVLDVPGDADKDKAIAVLRISESPLAPHVIDGRHVYERIEGQGRKWTYGTAEFHRVERLLERRKGWEIDREKMIETALRRALPQLEPRPLTSKVAVGTLAPVRWCSVIPYFPWRDLCLPADCYRLHPGVSTFRFRQQMPGGSFAVNGPAHDPLARSVSSITSRGHSFFAEVAQEATYQYEHSLEQRRMGYPPGHPYWISEDETAGLIGKSLRGAQVFFHDAEVQKPSHLWISFGYLDVAGFRMGPSDRREWPETGQSYLDSTFRHDEPATYAELESKGEAIRDRLMRHVAYGFDLRG
jgi:Schlafen, AlbA_2